MKDKELEDKCFWLIYEITRSRIELKQLKRGNDEIL